MGQYGCGRRRAGGCWPPCRAPAAPFIAYHGAPTGGCWLAEGWTGRSDCPRRHSPGLKALSHLRGERQTVETLRLRLLVADGCWPPCRVTLARSLESRSRPMGGCWPAVG